MEANAAHKPPNPVIKDPSKNSHQQKFDSPQKRNHQFEATVGSNCGTTVEPEPTTGWMMDKKISI